MADWFLPVPPVDTKNVKKYVDFIYLSAFQTFNRHQQRNDAWTSQTSITVTISETLLNQIWEIFGVDDASYIRHFMTVYSPFLRQAFDMDVEEKGGSIRWTVVQDEPDTHVLVELERPEKTHQPKGARLAFHREVRKALYKIYVEIVVHEVKLHLEDLKDHNDSFEFLREEQFRLIVGKSSFLHAKGDESFDTNDPGTWNMKMGLGSRWNKTYSLPGRLHGFERMMALVLLTDDDLPEFVLMNPHLAKLHSRESLAVEIAAALGRPRDAEGNLLVRPEDRTLMGCPVDNDPGDIGGEGRDEAGSYGGGDASVVYVVYKRDLIRMDQVISRSVEHLELERRPQQLGVQPQPQPPEPLPQPQPDELHPQSQPEPVGGNIKCGASGCKNCPYMVEGSSFKRCGDDVEYPIRQKINCKSTKVIYLITCDECKVQYVGRTRRHLGTRMKEHRTGKSSFVAKHFKQRNPGHTIVKNFKVTGIERTAGKKVGAVKTSLRERKAYWIEELGTKRNGLNPA